MGLHPVIAVICTEAEELGNILVPYVKVYGHGSLSHAQLIHCHCGIIYDPDPADDTACRTLKASDGAALGSDLSEVKAHASSEFADLRKVIH